MTDATGQQTAGGSTVHARSVEIESFIEHDYRRVVGSVALVTGDRAHAEDAVQDALVNAWRRRDEPIERLAGWVTVVASNTARSRHRRHRAERRALDRAGRGAAEQIADAEPFDAAARFAAEGVLSAGDVDWALGSVFRWGGTSSRAAAAELASASHAPRDEPSAARSGSVTGRLTATHQKLGRMAACWRLCAEAERGERARCASARAASDDATLVTH